ncbi:hypothetical protein [Actinoplanes rectilineatus]|uniref:hypothetical protein n=1 Tax=Actinoplanes rectilineatus TaxID=113571 RepID=UPI0005F2E13A|nr:hypothetical protein [Actinoplanes rectilineatus]
MGEMPEEQRKALALERYRTWWAIGDRAAMLPIGAGLLALPAFLADPEPSRIVPTLILAAAAGCGAAVYVSRRSFSWQAKWWLLGAWALLMVGGMLLTRTT